MISGFLSPSEGTILFEKKSIAQMKDEEASFYRNSTIGYLPQHIDLIESLNIYDNIRFGWREKREIKKL